MHKSPTSIPPFIFVITFWSSFSVCFLPVCPSLLSILCLITCFNARCCSCCQLCSHEAFQVTINKDVQNRTPVITLVLYHILVGFFVFVMFCTHMNTLLLHQQENQASLTQTEIPQIRNFKLMQLKYALVFQNETRQLFWLNLVIMMYNLIKQCNSGWKMA